MTTSDPLAFGGLCWHLDLSGLPDPEEFLAPLDRFRATGGPADIRLSVQPTRRVPAPVPHTAPVAEAWASLNRFPFPDRPETNFKLRVLQLRAFSGHPEIASHLAGRAADEPDRFAVLLSNLAITFFDPFTGEGRAFLDDRAGPANAHPWLNAIFYQLMSMRLAALGGLVLHGAGISLDGRGAVFLGLSGAGKTTSSRLSRAPLFSDDGVALKPVGSVWHVFPTPFCQQKGALWHEGIAAGSAPIDRLVFLEQAGEHRVAPLARPAAAVLILQHLIHFFRLFPRALAAETLVNVWDLLTSVRPQTLHFRQDAGFLDLLQSDQAERP